MADESSALEAELLELLGEDDLIHTAERIGGFRFYVPEFPERSEDKFGLGVEILTKLSANYAPDYIIVPMCKARRAKRMAAAGMSRAEIGRKLVITESGVWRLLRGSATKKKQRSKIAYYRGE